MLQESVNAAGGSTTVPEQPDTPNSKRRKVGGEPVNPPPPADQRSVTSYSFFVQLPSLSSSRSDNYDLIMKMSVVFTLSVSFAVRRSKHTK